MKKYRFPALILLLSAVVSGFQTAGKVEIVSLPKTAAVLEAAARLNWDLLMERDGRVFVVAPPADLRKIKEEGWSFRLETESFAPAEPSAESPLLSSPIGAYHTGAELKDDLDALEAQYPNLAKVFTIGTTLENRPILALKISDNVAFDEGEPGALFLGCHHAREWISVEVPFLLGKYLLENYSSNTEVKRLVDGAEIWIVPMVNPDGHDYTVRIYRYWRKNRRNNGDRTFGVDLNRNYGYAWGYDNTGSSPDSWDDTYRGKSAFSEPETRAVRDLVLSRNIATALSYHSYQQTLMFPWSYADRATLIDDDLAELSQRMAALMQAVNGRIYVTGRSSSVMYLVNGDTNDWTYAATGMASFTIELPPDNTYAGGFLNAEQDIAGIFAENLPAMLTLVDWAIAHPNPVPEPNLVNPRPVRLEPRRGRNVIR